MWKRTGDTEKPQHRQQKFQDVRTEVKVKSLSRVRLFATPWTVAHQSPQSMEFSRQEYWSGLPFPYPGDLPGPGIEPVSLTSPLNWQAGSLPLVPPGKSLFPATCDLKNFYTQIRVHLSHTNDISIVQLPQVVRSCMVDQAIIGSFYHYIKLFQTALF